MYMPGLLSLMISRRSSTWIGYFDPWVICLQAVTLHCLTRSYPHPPMKVVQLYLLVKRKFVIIVIGRIGLGLGYGAQRRGGTGKKIKLSRIKTLHPKCKNYLPHKQSRSDPMATKFYFSIQLKKVSSEWKPTRNQKFVKKKLKTN